jgi:hypothetical protein
LEQVFFRPYSLMPLLFECQSSDLIVYTHDLERRLTYMSESSWHVCEAWGEHAGGLGEALVQAE